MVVNRDFLIIMIVVMVVNSDFYSHNNGGFSG